MIAILLNGCSFQAAKPAPVDSIFERSKPIYNKGSLKSTRYKVKKGDTLYSISWGAGKDFVEIARLNRMKKPYTIYPGQVLYLQPLKPRKKPISSKVKPVSTRPQITSAPKVVKNQTPKSSKSSNQKQQQSAKKQLDRGRNSAYSVTSATQNINKSIPSSRSTLPKQVSRWFWPSKGRLVGTFSAKEQGSNGIKIAGRRGDIIKAAADGRVVYAGNALRGYGNLVIIKHSDDYLSAYAHADKILVKEKQSVTAGQMVAKMGSSGTNRVMLHFEVRKHGKSVNPLNYLPKR
ncbi:peptidoglycan DD-metalloendopeptidase family protein [Shewanella gelidii]|nr:peptidoglycan DD-metalloendopeptidase family protein [Shewanella gelidii]MCL1096585.1 peptidoglycan DD-metalloendopeptidase family protein [Shewanella gelidii]